MSESTDFDKLLNDINRLNEQDQHDVYILTHQKSVPFKPLTLKQQKDILSSTTHESPTVEFVSVIDEIIKENCMDFEIQLHNCDRSLIVLQLRSKAIGPTLNLYNKAGDRMKLNIDKHIEKIKKMNIDINDMLSFTVKNENIKIECEIPSTQIDTAINNQFNKQTGGEKESSMNRLIGDIYVYETLKYIKTISTQQVKLNFHENTEIESQIKIMESMPVLICSDIVKNIKKIREIEVEALRSDDLNGMIIPIDATLFTGE